MPREAMRETCRMQAVTDCKSLYTESLYYTDGIRRKHE